MPNGKVNRRALPEPIVVRERKTTRKPRNRTEEILNGIFSEVMQLTDIGIDDNLFEMGADSIQIFQIVARANRAGLSLTVQQILRNPAIEKLASESAAAKPKPRKPWSEQFAL